MSTILTIVHYFVCIFLILVVLLQAGRGGGIGLAFGSGGSQSVFGSSGGATLLTKATAVCAIIFFANSLALAYLSSQSDSTRLQKVAVQKAEEKKAQEAANSKMMTDIEKARAEKTNVAPGAGLSTERTGEAEAAPAAVPEAAKAEPAAPAAADKVATQPAVEKKAAAKPKAKKEAAPKAEESPAKAEEKPVKAEATEPAENQ